jgi:hypothetical protein
MCGRLYACDTLFERLAPDLEDMAAELRELIQEEHAVVRPRHLARHRHVAPADQLRIRDGVVGRAKRAGRDQRRAVASEARDAVDACGLNGLGEGHRRQDGGEPPCQHRRARPRGAKEQVAWNTKISSGFIDMTRLGPCEHSLEARPHQRLERLIVDLPTMHTCPPLPQHCIRGEAFRTAERLLEAGEHLR